MTKPGLTPFADGGRYDRDVAPANGADAMSKISVRMRCEQGPPARCSRTRPLRLGWVVCVMVLAAWPRVSAASLVVPAALSELIDEAARDRPRPGPERPAALGGRSAAYRELGDRHG